MTEPSHPDADLELASAHLDGETTDAESDAVEADPGLLALVDELGAVRTRLSPGPSPEGLVDRQVPAALVAFGAGDGATVVPLARGRGDRPWYQRFPVAAVAAALVVVALIGAVALTGSAGDDEETAADSGATTMEAAAEDASELDATEGVGADGALSPSMGVERPQFTDLDALASHVEGLLAGDDTAPQPEGAPAAGGSGGVARDDMGRAADAQEAPGCDPVAVAAADDATVAAVVAAVVDGRDVTAVVVEGDGRRMVVVDDASCGVVDERPL